MVDRICQQGGLAEQRYSARQVDKLKFFIFRGPNKDPGLPPLSESARESMPIRHPQQHSMKSGFNLIYPICLSCPLHFKISVHGVSAFLLVLSLCLSLLSFTCPEGILSLPCLHSASLLGKTDPSSVVVAEPSCELSVQTNE